MHNFTDPLINIVTVKLYSPFGKPVLVNVRCAFQKQIINFVIKKIFLASLNCQPFGDCLLSCTKIISPFVHLHQSHPHRVICRLGYIKTLRSNLKDQRNMYAYHDFLVLYYVCNSFSLLFHAYYFFI